jgi:hypothetical protein
LDPIEKAIRNALEKGNAEDRAFREKVYRSAFAALERATQAQPNLTVEIAINRRKNLQAKITSIESEFLPALPAEPEEAPAVSVAPPGHGPAAAPAVETPGATRGGRSADAPSVQLDSDAAPGSTGRSPTFDVEAPAQSFPRATPANQVSPDRDDARAQQRRRPFAAMFVGVTLLGAAAIGGWWAYQMGLFKLPSELDALLSNPPQVVEEEDFTPEGAEGAPVQPGSPQELRNWVTVFSPDDPSLVNAPTGAGAEVSEDESGTFMRIRSGTTGGAVVFDVGQGILEQISGKKAVFDIVARAAEGKPTEISISCDFGELGDCGRRRYAVGYERGEYLFDVELPAKRPGAGGSIAIDSDFANEGKAVDIYQIRVSVVP